jgi:hypothetical protein
MPTVPGSSLNYTTPRLERDVEIMGPASADLWLSSTSSDTDLQVTVTEVRPDGQEQYVQRGWLRASHRMLDPQASTVTDPVATHRRRDARPLTPSVPTLVRVEVWPVGHTFRAGSSIRLTIDSPTGLTGFFGFAFTPDPAANTILHDAGHPSSLALPVLPGAAAQTPLPTCAGFEQAPCRPNHTAIPSGSVDLHADDDLGLPSTAGCVDRQRLALQLRSAGGERLVRARIRVSGRRPFVVRGAHRLSAPIAVRGLPPNSFLLRVVATTTSRHTLRAMRVYQTCL